MSWTTEVRRLAGSGLAGDNLRAIADASQREKANRLPAFVIEQIARGLAAEWDEGRQPVTTDRAKEIEAAIRDPLVATVEAIDRNGTADEIQQRLNALIEAYGRI